MNVALAGMLAVGLVIGWDGTARADASPDESVRVIIAGPKKDPLAARLEKELVTLGFTPVKSDAECDKASVASAASKASAAAALCSDGRRVAVWTSDPNKNDALELRDTVAPEPSSARDDVAMRAAEVMRANVEYREADPPPAKLARPAPLLLGGWEGFDDNPDHPPPEPRSSVQMTNLVRLAFGPAMLIGADTATTTLSGRLSIGVHSRFSLTGRLDFPVSRTDLAGSSDALSMQSGLVGGGVELPLLEPSAVVVPRFGLNGGGVWVRATESTGGGTLDGAFTPVASSAQTKVAPAAWMDAALSLGIYGPVRLAGELTFGSAFGRLTVMDANGNAAVHFGTPFGALALRMEIALQ